MPAKKDDVTGTWYTRFYIKDANGVSRQTTKRGFKTKKEAEEYERTIRSLNKGNLATVCVQDFVDRYFDEKIKGKKIKQRTATMKRYLFDTHIIPYFKDKKICEITPLDLENWQCIIQSKGYERTYERMIANQMSSLLNHAVTYYGLPYNPYKKITKMGNSEAKKEAQFWERDEYNLFISTFEPGTKYYVLFEILFWTGMRMGEALSLTYERINTITNEISIFETFHREKGKDILTEPKTEKSIRTITVPEFLVQEITTYYQRLYEYPANERLFPIVPRTVEKTMAAHIKKTGVPYITVHDLRHSHATYLMNNNVPLKAIANRLGHKNIKQLMNTYGHAAKKSEQQIANLLSELK